MPKKKVPFSGKAKKMQLQTKRMGKSANFLMTKPKDSSDDDDAAIDIKDRHSYINKGQGSRYALKLHKESDAELAEQKLIAEKEIIPVERSCLKVESDEYFPPFLNFPRRPPWSFDITRRELDARENRYFTEYLVDLEKKCKTLCLDKNIENWRQLWRVMEMSDILLFIVDIRFPNLLFPPFFYEYVNNQLRKQVIVVLNKIDLAPPSLVAAWKNDFLTNYPDMKIVMFTSFPSYNLRENSGASSGIKIKRRKGKLRMSAESAKKLQEVCQDIVKDNLDISSWKKKIIEETNLEFDDVVIDKVIQGQEDTGYFEHERYKEGILTIGCVGQPNVGKSSLINALMGRKVVSVSKTPGHTKHFQTIFLTPNVRLCDCPGLVFPSTLPKVLQILTGSFPIAQLREPYSTIRYLAERLNMIEVLKIVHPSKEVEWSAMDICEAWAIRKGFFTAKAARPDTYRSANHLLRMALTGQISLCFMPPGFVDKEDEWEHSEDIEYIKRIQGEKIEDTASDDTDEDSSQGDDADKEESESDRDSVNTRNRFDLLDMPSSD